MAVSGSRPTPQTRLPTRLGESCPEQEGTPHRGRPQLDNGAPRRKTFIASSKTPAWTMQTISRRQPPHGASRSRMREAGTGPAPPVRATPDGTDTAHPQPEDEADPPPTPGQLGRSNRRPQPRQCGHERRAVGLGVSIKSEATRQNFHRHRRQLDTGSLVATDTIDRPSLHWTLTFWHRVFPIDQFRDVLEASPSPCLLRALQPVGLPYKRQNGIHHHSGQIWPHVYSRRGASTFRRPQTQRLQSRVRLRLHVPRFSPYLTYLAQVRI